MTYLLQVLAVVSLLFPASMSIVATLWFWRQWLASRRGGKKGRKA